MNLIIISLMLKEQQSFSKRAHTSTQYRASNPTFVHIWSSRKDIKNLRVTFAYQWFIGYVPLWILIFLMCTFYLGAGHDPNEYTGNIDVDIVDFDGEQAGILFLDAFRSTPPGNLTLHWRYKYPDDFGNCVDETRQAVDEGQVWAIVALRPNITSTINMTLLALINSTKLITYPFINTASILISYDEGRNSFTQNTFVLPPIRAAIAVANNRYAQILRTTLISNFSSTSNSSTNRILQLNNTLRIISLLANPFVIEYNNLHPALPFVGPLNSIAI